MFTSKPFSFELPNGQALTGFNHEYKRHGTTTLFAALDVLTGIVMGGHYSRRRRREFNGVAIVASGDRSWPSSSG